MTCPDWSRLDAEAPLDRSTRIHADTCDDCRRRALRHDPTLVFRTLPQVTVSTDDIESMKRAVAAMRRGSAIERSTSEAGPISATRRADSRFESQMLSFDVGLDDVEHDLGHETAPRPLRTPPKAWPASLRAAVLTTALLGASAGLWAPWEAPNPAADTTPVAAVAANATAIDTAATDTAAIGGIPSLDGQHLARAHTRGPLLENVGDFDEVIQMAYDDLDLVVVIDSKWEASNLDV